jgi:hypothetical protein
MSAKNIVKLCRLEKFPRKNPSRAPVLLPPAAGSLNSGTKEPQNTQKSSKSLGHSPDPNHLERDGHSNSPTCYWLLSS